MVYFYRVLLSAMRLILSLPRYADSEVERIICWELRKIFWLCTVICLAGFATLFKWVPETKGRTLDAIEGFWDHKSQSTSPR